MKERFWSCFSCSCFLIVFGAWCFQKYVWPAAAMLLLRSYMKKPCRYPGSNRGPSDLRSDALSTELSRLGSVDLAIRGLTLTTAFQNGDKYNATDRTCTQTCKGWLRYCIISRNVNVFTLVIMAYVCQFDHVPSNDFLKALLTHAGFFWF